MVQITFQPRNHPPIQTISHQFDHKDTIGEHEDDLGKQVNNIHYFSPHPQRQSSLQKRQSSGQAWFGLDISKLAVPSYLLAFRVFVNGFEKPLWFIIFPKTEVNLSSLWVTRCSFSPFWRGYDLWLLALIRNAPKPLWSFKADNNLSYGYINQISQHPWMTLGWKYLVPWTFLCSTWLSVPFPYHVPVLTECSGRLSDLRGHTENQVAKRTKKDTESINIFSIWCC